MTLLYSPIGPYSSSVIQKYVKRIAMLPKLLESPFQTLGCTVQQVVKALTYAEVTFEWEYMIEPETGLRILRAEKDPEALSHVREIADRLFE